MFKKFYKKKRNERFERMMSRVPDLSDKELKEWFIGADTQRVIGDACDKELSLLDVIENELVKRGFEYQVDF